MAQKETEKSEFQKFLEEHFVEGKEMLDNSDNDIIADIELKKLEKQYQEDACLDKIDDRTKEKEIEEQIKLDNINERALEDDIAHNITFVDND